MWSIGQMSQATGVKIPTIRYYEDIGLLPCEGRTSGNQRRYSANGLGRLTFIKHARDLGLPLGAIAELISLDAADHAETHRLASDHLKSVQTRIARLQNLEDELTRILASCDGGAGHDCTILSAFGVHTACEADR